VRAQLLARRGEHSEAEQLAREALGLAEDTDMLNWHGNVLAALAEVYVLAGRVDDGLAQLERALALYEQKGNLVAAAGCRAKLDDLKESAPVG
jgi:tetratricopeptide (TPR) repeat protein